MRNFNFGGVCYEWQPEKRVLKNTFIPGTKATRPKGERVVAALDAWIPEQDTEPYCLLCDGSGADEIDIGYRQLFAEFFVTHPNVTLAVYAFPVDIRMVPILFGLATEINLKAFVTEEEALAWVRAEGFDV